MNWFTASNKLSDCLEHGPSTNCELFVVEGDSAARTVCQLRNERSQAVLPMQGKPLNAIKASRKRVENSPLFEALQDAVGRSNSPIRYQRIILLFDPDADGVHCGVLMLMYLYKYMNRLLSNGHIFLARAPLLELLIRNTQSGRVAQSLYAYTEQSAARLIRDVHLAGIEVLERNFYRGLANIPAPTLRSTCLNSNTRKLLPLGIQDAVSAIKIFSP